MSDPASDEIDDIVSQAVQSEPKKPRRMVSRTAKQREKSDDNADSEEQESLPQRTMEELDLSDILPKDLPKPAENVKTLGDMIAKYGIGDNPEFKLQVWRTYPKLFPGGLKADGFYDTWEQPLSEELIQSEYGGGTFRVVVQGPHPTKPNTPKHYDSVTLQLAGEPKYQRIPRALQGKEVDTSAAPPPPPMMMQSTENPKLAETAMKLAVDMADKEREERRRMEDRAGESMQRASAMVAPVVEAERKRADDVLAAQRERADSERRFLQERLEEERDSRKRLEARLESLEMNRPSMASELRELAPLFGPRGDEGKTAERMLESVLEKHRGELDSLRQQSNQMIETMNRQHAEVISSMRGSHQNEITSLRESNARELAAERDAGRRREERVEDQLKMEREERRRDQERGRELLDERDRQWKDRIEMQVASTNQAWEARHQSVIGNYENRILWMQQEVDRLKSEVGDLRNKAVDSTDPIAIVHKAKEIKDAIGVPDVSPSSPSSSGSGIGISGGEDWKTIAAEGFSEKLPQLLQVVGNLLGGTGGAQQAPQQLPPVGSIVQHPQLGECVVVQDPRMPGGVGLQPRAAYEAQQAAAQAPRSRMLPSNEPRRARVMPDAQSVQPRPRKSVQVVPNLGEGLPKRRPPWEGGGMEESRPASQPQPRRTSAPTQAVQRVQEDQQDLAPAEEAGQEQGSDRRRMTPIERQAIQVIAKLVHDSVMNADEPDEFADKMMTQWSPDILRKMVGEYSPDDIARGIVELQPNSAGATPEGQKFVKVAFKEISERI
jgi:hypothetical protein